MGSETGRLLLNRIAGRGLLTVLFLTLIISPGISASPVEITPAEQAFLAQEGEIVFVSQTEYPPFEFIDDLGERRGMCIELAQWMAAELGFRARFIDMPFADAQEAVLSGEADVLTSLFHSEQRDVRFDFTETIFEVPASIFVRTERPAILGLEELAGLRVAIQRGDYAQDYLESMGIGVHVVPAASFAEATNLVIGGEADAIIGDEQIVLYHLFNSGLASEVKVVGDPLYIGQNCMAVREGQAALVTMLNRGLDLARERGVFDRLTRKWVGVQPAGNIASGWGYLPQILVGLGVVSAIALMILLWNFRLRHEIDRRTAALRESEERHRRLFMHSPLGLMHFDTNGIIRDCNDLFVEIVGSTREALIGLNMPERLRDERMIGCVREALAGRTAVFEGNYRSVTADKDTPLRAFYSPLQGDNDAVIGGIAIIEDVSERVRTECEQAQEISFRKAVIESAAQGLCVAVQTDDENRMRFTVWNRRMEEITGYTLEEINRLGWYRTMILDPDLRYRAIRQGEGSFGQDPMVGEEWEITRRDGESRTVQISSSTLPGDDGHPLALWLMQDVTERKIFERALREKENLLATTLESTAEGFLVVDDQGGVLHANSQFAKMWNVPQSLIDQGDDRKLLDHVLGQLADPEAFISRVRDLYATDAVGSDTLRFKDGRVVERYSAPLTSEGDVTGRLWSFRDITARVYAGEALELAHAEVKRSLAFTEALLSAVPTPIFCKDLQGRYITCNQAFADHTGVTREELRGKTVHDLWPSEHAETYHQADLEIMRSAHRQVYEAKLRDKRGNDRSVLFVKDVFRDENGAVAGIIGAYVDLTERKQLEEERLNLERQIQHSQKLESLGVLAGGIAHDFNNILMAILGNADLALSDISEVSPVRGNLEEIERSTRRAADLCRQMLAYSGRGKFVVKSMDLSELVEEMIHMLEISISKKAMLECHLARGLPPIEADASQIQQVVMNLITNASEAMGDQSGVISVTTGCVERGHERLVEGGVTWDLPGGRYVFVEVSDTGCGMDHETRNRLFEPFYSTKFTGRGLGLAAVQGIVQSHHGAITVTTEEGHGSTFRALFPASDATPSPASETGARRGGGKAEWRGSGTILIVDDEQAVLRISRQVLVRHGFDVITASDGKEGLRRFWEMSDQICCVILDLTMPHLDGEEVLQEIRGAGNHVPIILTSGYSEQEISRRFLGKGLAAFVQKPYRPADLVEAIRTALDG